MQVLMKCSPPGLTSMHGGVLDHDGLEVVYSNLGVINVLFFLHS